MIKKALIAVFFLVLSSSLFAAKKTYDFNEPFTPTKKEWLSLQLTQKYDLLLIKEEGIKYVEYMIGDQYVDIYVSEKGKMSSGKMEKFWNKIDKETRKILDQYDWSRAMLIRIKSRD